jgi:hypothetical protein
MIMVMKVEYVPHCDLFVAETKGPVDFDEARELERAVMDSDHFRPGAKVLRLLAEADFDPRGIHAFARWMVHEYGERFPKIAYVAPDPPSAALAYLLKQGVGDGDVAVFSTGAAAVDWLDVDSDHCPLEELPVDLP